MLALIPTEVKSPETISPWIGMQEYERRHAACRGLGLARAQTIPEDADDPRVMAVLALANMQPGDEFRAAGNSYTVVAQRGDKLILKRDDGRRISIAYNHNGFEQFVRDVESQIVYEFHARHADSFFIRNGAPPRYPLLEAARRDPVYCYRAMVAAAWQEGEPLSFQILADAGFDLDRPPNMQLLP